MRRRANGSRVCTRASGLVSALTWFSQCSDMVYLQEAGGVLMDRVSADDMHERKMALNILSISVKKPCLFYEKVRVSMV